MIFVAAAACCVKGQPSLNDFPNQANLAKQLDCGEILQNHLEKLPMGSFSASGKMSRPIRFFEEKEKRAMVGD